MARSQWFEYKEAAIALRKTGMSMTVIERKLGIPRSTLSGWFKSVPLTEEQRLKLMQNGKDGWLKARRHAVLAHNKAKQIRLLRAKDEALTTLESLELSSELLDLALAMLYLGEGAKSGVTSIANSDPMVLRFVLTVLKKNHHILDSDVRCDLHLRMDQDADKLKSYWSEELSLPIECFKYVAYDKRGAGKKTFDHYKGVCVISCGNIAIQRKLIFLYTLFCEKISREYTGA